MREFFGDNMTDVADYRSVLAESRSSPREMARVSDLMNLVPVGIRRALDVGARDGYLSVRLADKVDHVTALDLHRPAVPHERVAAVQGDATCLGYESGEFDLVLCSEVLEHIPQPALEKACHEIERVSGRYVLIGVPFMQDTRVGRTSCSTCGAKNPPYGHVNVFDEKRLRSLFVGMRVAAISYVGSNKDRTNALSAILNDFAGNPWGTYDQEEQCISCGRRLVAPSKRTVARRMAGKAAYYLSRAQQAFMVARPNWIHILFVK